jgi:hypothetical protein
MVDYAIETGVVTEPTKGWFDFNGQKVRKTDLTLDPTFGILKIEAMKARDARLAVQETHD